MSAGPRVARSDTTGVRHQRKARAELKLFCTGLVIQQSPESPSSIRTADLHLLWQDVLRLWNRNSQDAIPQLGIDTLGVDILACFFLGKPANISDQRPQTTSTE